MKSLSKMESNCNTLYSDATVSGNIGTGETDLNSFTLPASLFSTEGDRIRITACGEREPYRQQTLRLYIDGNVIGIKIMSSEHDFGWMCFADIIRKSSGFVKSGVFFSVRGTDSTTLTTTDTVTFSSALIIKFTGQALLNDDIQQLTMAVEHYPNPL